MDTGGRPTGSVAKPKTAHPLPQMAVPFGRRKVQPVRTGAATPVIQGWHPFQTSGSLCCTDCQTF